MRPRTAGILAAFFAAAALLARTGSTDIDKFGWVTDRVATGGQPTLPQIASLANEGFHGIVNLREPSEYDAAAEETAARAKGLAYINIPVNKDAPKSEQADAFLAALKNTQIYPVFIHCATGNRVAAFWMIRRVIVEKWDLEDAEREAKIVGLKTPVMKDFALEYIRAHPPISRKNG
jgi:uncharacterized protein (TIGR01244 family)